MNKKELTDRLGTINAFALLMDMLVDGDHTITKKDIEMIRATLAMGYEQQLKEQG